MFLLHQEINTAYIWGQGTFILISKLLKVINTKNSQTGQFIAKYGTGGNRTTPKLTKFLVYPIQQPQCIDFFIFIFVAYNVLWVYLEKVEKYVKISISPSHVLKGLIISI